MERKFFLNQAEWSGTLPWFIWGQRHTIRLGIFRKICALILSLFLEVHKVHLQKSAIIRTQIFSESALAALCGVAPWKR